MAAIPQITRLKRIIALLSILLIAAAAAILILSVHATRPLTHESDAPLIARTIAQAAIEMHTDEAGIRRRLFPIVMRTNHSICVELRAKRDDDGFYQACYRELTGQRVEERLGSSPFGPSRWWPPLLL